MEKIAQSATTSYILHERPAYVTYLHGGTLHKSFLNGSTVALVCGTWIPVGCPRPEKVVYGQWMLFLVKNARWIPAVFLACIAIIVLHILLLSFEGGDMAAAWIEQFSGIMNTTLVVLFCLCLVSYSISQFKKGIKVEFEFGAGGEKMLGSGSTSDISISPDVAVFSESENEEVNAYKARVSKALKESGGWVVVLPFRSEYGVIHTSGNDEESEGFVFLRSNPPHDGGDVITFEEAVEAKAVYCRERWSDYVAYCAEFSRRYNVWATTEKIRSGANPLSVLMNRAAFVVFAVLLSCSGLFAQKSEQVRGYLGTVRYTQDMPVGEVDFVFQKKVHTRSGDGSTTYENLLKSGRYSDSEDVGKLVGVTVGGKVVLPVPKRNAESQGGENTGSLKPVETLPVSAKSRGFFEGLPDSSQLEVMKRQSILERQKQWAKVQPVLDYYMWRFWSWMIILLGVGGIMYVLSKAAATDAIYDLGGYPLIGNMITWIHIVAKTALFFILCIPTVVILGADVIEYYYTQDFSIFWVIKYAVVCILWYWVLQKIIPNSPGWSGPSANQAGNYPVNNNRRLLN